MICILCKIYNDGSSFIAQPVFKSKKVKKREDPVLSKADNMFDSFYETLERSLSVEEQKEFIVSKLLETFPNSRRIVEDFVEKKFKDKARNLSARRKRFLRKVNLVNLEEYVAYFVTFTYDSSKLSEEVFEKKLRRSLSNFHTRRGWLYALVDERGELGERLHFHGIIFVPPGEMVGKFEAKSHYSKKQHKFVEYCENDFFAKKFGVNDFVDLSQNRSEFSRRVNYVIKYLGKTGNRVIYSRGLPVYIYKDMDEIEFLGEFFDYVLKYIVFDNVIYNPDRIVRMIVLPDLSEFIT